MARVRLVAVVIIGALLGGCLQTMPLAPHHFDGQLALEQTKAFALRTDGTPRYRIPGTAGQLEGARHLWNETDLPGWTRTFENFTGADYIGLDRTPVRDYGPGSYYCPPSFMATLPTRTFSNLLVTKQGPVGAPTLAIGAHWDSQPESNYDSNPANRTSPDPGANDGASGVGVLLQLMRELSGVNLNVTLRLFFIDGEDGFYACYPLAGSLWHVQRGDLHEDALILLDMVGDAGALFPRETQSQSSAPALVDLVWQHGTVLAPGHFLEKQTSIEDDHLAYIHAGLLGVDIIDAGRPHTFPPQWDTAGDTVDKLDATIMGQVGETLVAVLRDAGLTAAMR